MNVLVVGAHPDDEVIGLAGTIVKHVKAGDEVSVLILTNGQSSRDRKDESEKVEQRYNALKQSCQILGVKSLITEDYPDQGLDTIELTHIVKSIEKHASSILPDVAYFHHRGDLNMDHQIVYNACLTAFRPTGDNYPTKLFCYETMSSTEWGSPDSYFVPNHIVDITPYYSEKEKALKCYEMELREYPHPRSLKAIEVTANKWGSVIGVTYAEAFILIRSVELS